MTDSDSSAPQMMFVESVDKKTNICDRLTVLKSLSAPLAKKLAFLHHEQDKVLQEETMLKRELEKILGEEEIYDSVLRMSSDEKLRFFNELSEENRVPRDLDVKAISPGMLIDTFHSIMTDMRISRNRLRELVKSLETLAQKGGADSMDTILFEKFSKKFQDVQVKHEQWRVQQEATIKASSSLIVPCWFKEINRLADTISRFPDVHNEAGSSVVSLLQKFDKQHDKIFAIFNDADKKLKRMGMLFGVKQLKLKKGYEEAEKDLASIQSFYDQWCTRNFGWIQKKKSAAEKRLAATTSNDPPHKKPRLEDPATCTPTPPPVIQGSWNDPVIILPSSANKITDSREMSSTSASSFDVPTGQHNRHRGSSSQAIPRAE